MKDLFQVVLVFMVGLAGCERASTTVEGLRIRGASEEARVRARAVHAEFEANIFPHTITIASIDFTTGPLGYGHWDAGSHTVMLDEALELEDIEWALRRQLCFALADVLADGGWELSDAFANVTLPEKLDGASEEPQVSAFARACGLGPWVAYVLDAVDTQGCEPDQIALAQVFRDLGEHVWLGYERPPILIRLDRVSSRTTTSDVRLVSAHTWPEPGLVMVEWAATNKFPKAGILDVATGDLVMDLDFGSLPKGQPLPDDLLLPPSPLVQRFSPIDGSRGGATLGFAEIWLPPPWRVHEVLLYGDAAGWIRTTDSCGSDSQWGSQYFVSDDQLMQVHPSKDGFDWHLVGRSGAR